MTPGAPWQERRTRPRPPPEPYAPLPPVRLPPWRCGTPHPHWHECSPAYGLGGRVPFDALALPDAVAGAPGAGPRCEAGEEGALAHDPEGMAAELAEVGAQARYALDRREWALYVELAAGYPEVQDTAERWESCWSCQNARPDAPPLAWTVDREICPAHRLEVWLVYGVEVPDPKPPEPVATVTIQAPQPGIGDVQQLPLW